MKVTLSIILPLVVLGLGTTRAQKLPTIEKFLKKILNVTSNEIESFAASFNTRDVRDTDVTFLRLVPNGTELVTKTNIRRGRGVKLLIHGWFASAVDDILQQIADEYHRSGAVEVLAADWSSHSKKNYFHAASNTKQIGAIIAEFLLASGVDVQQTHVIGHSLGAQIAGFVGKYLVKATGTKLGRITGLDVAAPLFEVPTTQSQDLKLTRNDAQIVDNIHTNAGFFGIVEASGTSDFYIENGGPVQPGCFDPINIFESFACSHYKSTEYFLDSIRRRDFEAVACPNSIQYHLLACNKNQRVKMGEHLSRNASGTFYLEATSALPYQGDFEQKFQPRILLPRFF